MRKQAVYILTVTLFAAAMADAGSAGEADVIDAMARKGSGGVWHFDVTIKHADEGWEHYANRFDVVAPDGTVLGVRTLFHPHVQEQPFTRSLGDVSIPEGVKKVTIRANDSVHELGGKEIVLELSD